MDQRNGISDFAFDVQECLSAPIKRIPIKYGYDDIGSRIYQQICNMPEYYITKCELEILSTKAPHILHSLQFQGKFNVVDLGCGDGTKTLQLLIEFQKENADFLYIPIDISAEAVEATKGNVRSTLPGMPMTPYVGDFYSVLPNLKNQDSPNLFLLLGATIGNVSKMEATEFLTKVHELMRPGDKILIGHDLRSKNPSLIHRAYDDPTGFEKAYNLNLIRRMRSELKMEIQETNFDYYVSYNPENGELRGYLISLEAQTVFSPVLNKLFHFQEWETIATMFAKKYTLDELTSITCAIGMNLVEHFLDSKRYLSCSLFRKESST